MADVKFEVVRVALSTGVATTTQDIDISGFGEPSAAIFITGYAAADDVIRGAASMAIGFTDGTNENCMSASINNGAATTNTSRAQRTDCVIAQVSNDAVFARFSFNAWTSNGVQIIVDDQDTTSRLCTVILIGGADVSGAFVGIKDLGTGTSAVTCTGALFEPDLVFATCTGNAAASPVAGAAGILSFGCAHNDTTVKQGAILIGSHDGQSATVADTVVANDSLCGQLYGGTYAWHGGVTSFDADGFSVTPSSSASNDDIYYLALKFANSPDISLFDMTWPDTGSYAETTPGFTPNFGMIAAGAGATARNTKASTNGLAMSIATFDDSPVVYTHTITDEDAATTTVSRTLASDQLRILHPDGATNDVVATHAFDADGWDFTISTNPAADILGWGLAIGAGAAGGSLSIPIAAYHYRNNIGSRL